MYVTSFLLGITMPDKQYDIILKQLIDEVGHWPPTDEELICLKEVVVEFCKDNDIPFTIPYRKERLCAS